MHHSPTSSADASPSEGKGHSLPDASLEKTDGQKHPPPASLTSEGALESSNQFSQAPSSTHMDREEEKGTQAHGLPRLKGDSPQCQPHNRSEQEQEGKEEWKPAQANQETSYRSQVPYTHVPSSSLPASPRSPAAIANESPRLLTSSSLRARMRALAAFMPLRLETRNTGETFDSALQSPFTPSAPPVPGSESGSRGSPRDSPNQRVRGEALTVPANGGNGTNGTGADDHDMAMERSMIATRTLHLRKMQVAAVVAQAKARMAALAAEEEIVKKEKGWWADLRRWWERERLQQKNKATRQAHATCKVWVGSLKAIEGRFGSATMSTFSFLRWTFFLNIILALEWLGLIVLPFWISPPKAFKWSLFTEAGFSQFVQGNNLERTWLFYGGYTYKAAEQRSWYRTDYAYPCAIAAMYLLSLVAICCRIAQRIMGSGDVSVTFRNLHYPFSTLVFGSWDFHLTNLETAERLRRGILMQLRELLADCKAQEEKDRGRLTSRKLLLRIFALGVLTPVLFAGSVALIASIVTNSDTINYHFGNDYLPAVLLAIVNTIGPIIVRHLVDFESWRPATAEHICTTKLFVLRILTTATLFYRLYGILSQAVRVREKRIPAPKCSAKKACPPGFLCCSRDSNTYLLNSCATTLPGEEICAPICVENFIARQLLRLIIVTTIFNSVYELVYGFSIRFMRKVRRQLLIEDMAIDILYLQALVWVGACFSPVAPLFGVLSNAITFYVMKAVLFLTCAPPTRPYSASYTRNLSYKLLLATLILCSIPTSVVLSQSCSEICGPIRGSRSMYQVIAAYVERAPNLLWVILQWIASPVVLFGIIALLAFLSLILRAKLVKYKRFLNYTKRELDTLRREAQEKISIMRLQATLDSELNPHGAPSSPLSPMPPNMTKTGVRFPQPLAGSKASW